MTAWQTAKRLFQNGRTPLATLVVLNVLMAWAAVALVPPTLLIAAGAPVVVLNALLRWKGSRR